MKYQRWSKMILLLITVAMGFVFIQCTHEDSIPTPDVPDDIVRGTAIINEADGWYFDKAHSNVMWETPYLFGAGALLTGRFNSFDINIKFDEAHPENIAIDAWVVLSTVNTGEPGRDDGCLLNTFGIAEFGDTAWFSSNTAFYEDGGSGFETVGQLTFHGVTDPVQFKFYFTGITHFDDIRGNPLDLAGFSGEFKINAKTIFGINSDNIDDVVTIKTNAQLKYNP